MDTTTILAAVKSEIARLQQVVDLLEAPASNPQPHRALNPNAKKGHVWSAKQRAEMSRKLKASWAARNRKSKKS